MTFHFLVNPKRSSSSSIGSFFANRFTRLPADSTANSYQILSKAARTGTLSNGDYKYFQRALKDVHGISTGEPLSPNVPSAILNRLKWTGWGKPPRPNV